MSKKGLVSFLVLLGGVTLMNLFIWSFPKSPELGLVDTSLLVTEQAKHLAQNNPESALTPQRMRQITDNLKDQIGDWCLNRNIILLSKGAVWGGEITDYTQEILQGLDFKDDDQ